MTLNEININKLSFDELADKISLDECMELFRDASEETRKKQDEECLREGGITCEKCGRAYPADYPCCPFCNTSELVEAAKAKLAAK